MFSLPSLQLRGGLFLKEFRRFVQSKNPGINRRGKLLSVPQDETVDDIEFEDLESDFMQVDKSHKEHMREVKLIQEREKYLIVRQKYFKEKFPNFLTWHDKEQIKYLHNSNPEEWTVEVLSESFPALPEVIAKIVKGNWKKSENRIKNHDAAVQMNWNDFKCGKLSSLPSDLVEHLKKFTDRSLNFNSFKTSKPSTEIAPSRNIRTEFSDIISSYKKGKNNSSDQSIEFATKNKKTIQEPPKQDTFMNQKFSSKKNMLTLTQLQSSLVDKAFSGGEIDDDDKSILNSLKISKPGDIENQTSLKPETVDLSQMKYNTDSDALSTYFKKSDGDLSHLNYPEKICIAKELRKIGATYKLNDCYYDYDGVFLYRVPGMG